MFACFYPGEPLSPDLHPESAIYGGSLGQKVLMTKSPNALAPSHNLFCTHENSIPFLHRDLAAAYDVHAYEMHANEVHAHNVHTSEVRAMRCTPMRCTPVGTHLRGIRLQDARLRGTRLRGTRP
jgi:hypothetical protein